MNVRVAALLYHGLMSLHSKESNLADTVVPHLVLSQALCIIDVVVAEWHSKFYRGGGVFQKAAALENLGASEVGASTAASLVAAIEGWAARITHPRFRRDDCRTRFLPLDDESYLHSRVPWPKVGSLCKR